MDWMIEQRCEGEWAVRLGTTVHLAQTAAAAVELLVALRRAGQ